MAGETKGKYVRMLEVRTNASGRQEGRARPPSTTAYRRHGIASSSHSSRCSTLPRPAANHHYLSMGSFFRYWTTASVATDSRWHVSILDGVFSSPSSTRSQSRFRCIFRLFCECFSFHLISRHFIFYRCRQNFFSEILHAQLRGEFTISLNPLLT